MKFKRHISLILALAMILALCACGGGASTPSAAPSGSGSAPAEKKETYTITAITTYNEDSYVYAGYAAFKEYVEKESGGRITVDIYPNGSLTNGDSATMEHISSGAYTLGNTDYTMIGSFTNDNRWESTSIPWYYGSDMDKVYDVLDNSEAWAELYESAATNGNMKVMGVVNGGLAVVGSDVPVNSMADFAGKRYRTATSDPYLKPVEGWGASAIAMAFSEIYTSVQNKAINGTFTSMSSIYSRGLTDVMKYMVRVDAFNLMFGYIMNNDFYNSLDAEAKAIVDEGAKVMNDAARKAEAEYAAELDDLMAAAGVTYIVPDAAWKAELENALTGYIDQRLAALDSAWLAKLNEALGK